MPHNVTVKGIETEFYCIELIETRKGGYIVAYTNDEQGPKLTTIFTDMRLALEVFDIKLSLLQGH